MAKLNLAIMATSYAVGAITARLMSNSGGIVYHGDSYFFSYQDSHEVADLPADLHTKLNYTDASGMLVEPPMFAIIEGDAAPIKKRQAFVDHWTKDPDRYFPDGIDTPGIVMIRITPRRIHYWNGSDEGESTP